MKAVPKSHQPFAPIDLEGLATFSVHDRPSKVSVDDLGRPLAPTPVMLDFVNSLPTQLAGVSLRKVCRHLVRSAVENKITMVGLGGHVIKTGCAPYLIDLMRRGLVTGLAMNGAAAIHDLELALAGKTSEDVGPRLVDGSFGMAKETAELYAAAARRSRQQDIGLGFALGQILDEADCPFASASLLIQTYRMGRPCTIHAAIGTDVVHMHECMDGQDLGAGSLLDFRILTGILSQMAGGVWMNLGCAVILPEVFLKAVSIVNNLGHTLDGLVTVNLDMIQQYRGRVNVCQRPTEEGIMLTGHHEIMIPLIHAITVAEHEQQSSRPYSGPQR